MNRDGVKARAEDFLDGEVAYWEPKPGGVVVGVVREIDIRGTQYDANVPVITLQVESGELVQIWAFWSVLRNELRKLAPEIGSEIAVRRLNDSERGYRRYRVFTDQAERAFDWGSIETNASDAELLERQEHALLDNPAAASVPPNKPADDLPF